MNSGGVFRHHNSSILRDNYEQNIKESPKFLLSHINSTSTFSVEGGNM